MTRLRWDRAHTRPTVSPDPEPVAGAWTHIKREPVRVLSPDERAAFIASRPDLQNPRPRRPRRPD